MELSFKLEEMEHSAKSKETQILQLQEEVKTQTQEAGKLMVSNQNAKVSHFNQVKMELVNARNDKNVLQQKVREQDEKEKKWLKKANDLFHGFCDLESKVLAKIDLKNLDGQQFPNQIPSLDMALNMSLERISSFGQLIR